MAFGLSYQSENALCEALAEILGDPAEKYRQALESITKKQVAKIARNELQEEGG